jgi:hypothetical protein
MISVRVPRSLKPSNPVPSSTIIKFGYGDSILIASSTSFIVYDLRLNNLTSVDPLKTSPAVGVPFWSQGYSQYRVLKIRFQYSFVTNEPTSSQTFGITFKDYQPTLALTSATLATQSLICSPSTGINAIGEATGMSKYSSPVYSFSPACLLGDPSQYLSEKDFTGNFSAGPIQTLWAGLVLLNPIVANVGGVFTINISFTTKLYSISPNAL